MVVCYNHKPKLGKMQGVFFKMQKIVEKSVDFSWLYVYITVMGRMINTQTEEDRMKCDLVTINDCLVIRITGETTFENDVISELMCRGNDSKASLPKCELHLNADYKGKTELHVVRMRNV